MYKHPLLAAAASAAILSLAACGSSEPEVLNQYDPQEEALKNAAPVQLPAAMIASRTYRCSPDNSLFYVDFYNDNTARIRTSREGAPVTLTAPGANAPYAGTGYSVSANAATVQINGKSCRS
jgi:hypothetical protein